MRKFFILFVALFATSALWAQEFEAGDGLRYAVTSESTVEVVGYNWYDNVLEIPSEVNGPAFPNEALPDLPNPGAGKVTICVQVPQPLCEGMGIAIPGTITTWSEGPAGANGQWINKVDGTDTWYAGSFDWKGDESSYNPRFKIVPANADGSWTWDYQAYDLDFVKGDVWREYEGGDVYVGVDNQVIYIRVLGWQNIVCTDESNLEQTTYQVTGIAPYAFSGIQSHVALTIPSSISYIGEGAFSEFYGSVVIEGTIPPSGYNGAFHPDASICVPCSALENFFNSVEGYPPTLVGVNHRLSLATDAAGTYVHVIESVCETGSVTIEAYGANEFVSFSQWSDGNTDNPRTLTLTQDTTIIAHYTEKPSYNVRLEGYNLRAYWDGRWGYEEMTGESIEFTVYDGTKITVEDYLSEFASFSQWSDGITENPRTIIITRDTVIKSQYVEKPTYNVTLKGNNLHASWNGRWGYEEMWGENIEFIAYEGTTVDFSEESGCGTWLGWSDGEMEQWRSIVVTSDTVITSRFDVATYSVRIVAEEGGYLENYEYIVGGYGEEIIVPDFSECHPSINCCVYPNNEEYMFLGWSTGNTDQCLYLDFYSIYSDTTIVAKFARFDQCGDSLTWEYDPLTTTLTITGTGDMYDYSHEVGPWAAYASEITNVVLPEGLTSIGSYAFRNCSSLVSIAIPSTVTTINDNAFAYCSVLSSINLPVGLTHVGNYAFEGCSSITSVSIPDGVTYLGTGAFDGCSELTYLSIPSSVDFVYVDQDGWVYYNYSMWIIGQCYKLKTLIAPADFFGAVPDEYGEILEEMAYFTNNLESLTIISGDELHPLTFDFINHNHRNIKHIDLSASTSTTLAEEAFENCYKLDSLVLPAQLEKIPYMAVAECVNLQSIVIPASVVEIDDRAFENCRMLSSITFAEDGELSRIGNWAFYNNHELTNIVIPEGVTEIGHAAFYGCTYLNELTLPSTMQQVADNGFALCGKLKKMTVKAMTPPAIHAKTFFDVDRQIPVYVPDEVVDTYKNDPYWKEFNIQGKSNAPTSVENTVANGSNVQKIVRDGQLLILREGKTYSVMGQEM